MKSKFIIIYFLFFFDLVFAETINIKSKNITIDKDQEITIFKDTVQFKTEDGKIIESDYAEYNKKKGIIKLKQKVKATDNKNNKILTDQAEYDQNTKVFKSFKSTEIVTSENYILRGKNITVDNKDFIISEDQSILEDTEGNKIYLENFTYNVRNRIFKSIGLIRIEDKFDNSYEFTQIYIDTKKKEILGTDIKSYLNNDKFKLIKNKPRIFADSKNKEKENLFNKYFYNM